MQYITVLKDTMKELGEIRIGTDQDPYSWTIDQKLGIFPVLNPSFVCAYYLQPPGLSAIFNIVFC